MPTPEAPATETKAPQTPAAPARPSATPKQTELPPHPKPTTAPTKHRRPLVWIVVLIIVGGLGVIATPWIVNVLNTVSTDDAYVNGHVTFVAPRVAGQVLRVLVDDNNRVHQGDLLVQIDPEPFQVQVDIAQAAVNSAAADLVVAQAQTLSIEGQVRSARFNLDHSIEDVDNQIALLHSKVATLGSMKASLDKAQLDYDRAAPLVVSGAVSKTDLDARTAALLVGKAQYEEALQGVYQVRVSLGQPAVPTTGDDLTQLPPDLDQTFSTVRQAQATLIQDAAQLGVTESFNLTPKEMVADFYKRDPDGNIDRIYAQLLKDAPGIKQAEEKLAVAKSNLEQADLNLRYTNVVAEIDGVVSQRSVNPGDNVVVGQSLMAMRSLTDIWVDANFKETQLADLRIGQEADLDVDMYGRHRMFKGRISGFENGTGSTLALLPAENATGNFVKVVQRLPVRIDLVDYDPGNDPLFVGLSVTPTVYINRAATGQDAGKVLQPYLPTAAPPATTLPTATAPETQP
jgi:membrane fusion protein (multidrug efflux system)